MLLDLLFAKTALKFANNIAIVFEDESRSLTYSELDYRSQALSASLNTKLIKVGGVFDAKTTVISIMTNRDIGMIVAILAVLKCGGSYVPVDPSFPPDRQSHIFSHSRSKCLLTDPETYNDALKLGTDLPPVILFDPHTGKLIDDNRSPSRDSSPLHSRSRNGEDIAYVLYTSGSTGKPKGVMVTHQGVVNIVQWFAEEMNINQSHNVLGLTTFCFDISVLEMFMPLLYGATLVIAKSSTQKDPFRLLDILQQHRITVMQATPTTFEMMLATGWTGDKNIDLLIGGEAFRPSLIPLITASKSVRNVYGPTETTIWSSCYNFQGKVPYSSSSSGGNIIVPIGTPISQTDFFLADVSTTTTTITTSPTSPVSVPLRLAEGDEGELLIGGIGVAKGYLHAPDLTAQRFFPSPFNTEGFVYRTGDLVKRMQDGNYVFVRRLDDQVKVNGYRIELAEIELALSAFPLVEQTVVLVRSNQLVAYIKPRSPNITLGVDEMSDLRLFAARSLTTYMMPKSIVVVEYFPQTANGKLDRNALPDPPPEEEDDNDVKEQDDSDFNELDQLLSVFHTSTVGRTLADHVCDVMERFRDRRPRPTASFSSIGVDSLGAILFLRLLSDSLGGIRISPSDIYGPGITINSFASKLHERLLVENPELLKTLNIDSKVINGGHGMASMEAGRGGGSGGGSSGGSGGGSGGGGGMFKASGDNVETFDDRVMDNRNALEGLRGVFMLFVLWDHYKNSNFKMDNAYQKDTDMFVIISGFTTALQLRNISDNDNDDDDNENDERKPWDWRKFIWTRFVGIFPGLWLALLLNSVRWHNHDKYANTIWHRHFKDSEKTQCVILYIVGMQGWSRPLCHMLGPNDTLYACQIWNVFLMYTAFRVILDLFQRKVHSYKPPMSTSTSTSISNTMIKFRQLILNLGNNSHCTKGVIIVSICFFLFFFAMFYANSECGTKAPIAYLVDFMSGVAAASIFETIFNCIYKKSDYTPINDEIYHHKMDNNYITYDCFFNIIKKTLQHISPDICMTSILIMFSRIGSRFKVEDQDQEIFIQNVAIQYVTIFLILSLLFQTKDTRICITRLFIENWYIRIIGYSSYYCYLLQTVTTSFYMRIIYDLAIGAPVTSDPAYGAYWENEWLANRVPWWWKPIGLVVVTSVAYIAQRYYQDTFIAWLLSSTSSTSTVFGKNVTTKNFVKKRIKYWL